MMKLKTMLIIKAVVCLTLGVPVLLAPAFMYSFFGTSLNPGGIFVARQYGASLIGNLMLTWFARKAIESEARHAIVVALFVYDGIGFIITLLALFTGALNWAGWLIAVLYLLLTLGFGYFLLPQKKTA
jgi:hypothetical protein